MSGKLNLQHKSCSAKLAANLAAASPICPATIGDKNLTMSNLAPNRCSMDCARALQSRYAVDDFKGSGGHRGRMSMDTATVATPGGCIVALALQSQQGAGSSSPLPGTSMHHIAADEVKELLLLRDPAEGPRIVDGAKLGHKLAAERNDTNPAGSSAGGQSWHQKVISQIKSAMGKSKDFQGSIKTDLEGTARWRMIKQQSFTSPRQGAKIREQRLFGPQPAADRRLRFSIDVAQGVHEAGALNLRTLPPSSSISERFTPVEMPPDFAVNAMPGLPTVPEATERKYLTAVAAAAAGVGLIVTTTSQTSGLQYCYSVGEEGSVDQAKRGCMGLGQTALSTEWPNPQQMRVSAVSSPSVRGRPAPALSRSFARGSLNSVCEELPLSEIQMLDASGESCSGGMLTEGMSR